jgi:hypothetical protein
VVFSIGRPDLAQQPVMAHEEGVCVCERERERERELVASKKLYLGGFERIALCFRAKGCVLYESRPILGRRCP